MALPIESECIKDRTNQLKLEDEFVEFRFCPLLISGEECAYNGCWRWGGRRRERANNYSHE